MNATPRPIHAKTAATGKSANPNTALAAITMTARSARPIAPSTTYSPRVTIA